MEGIAYENPLYFAEEAAALDLIADNRIALGISRGSPEPALRGWESFGYTGSEDPRGADIARLTFDRVLEAISGRPIAPADPAQYGPGQKLPLEPHSPGLQERLWWGAGSRDTAVWAAQKGVNLMSSTLLTEATGQAFGDLQAEQIDLYRREWASAGHAHTPRVSVSRSVFPVVTAEDQQFYQLRQGQGSDQVGIIDGFRSTFGRTYVGEPDELIDELKNDAAVMSADTLMLTIPSQLGVDFNARLLHSFAQHVAPALGWASNREGPVQGYTID